VITGGVSGGINRTASPPETPFAAGRECQVDTVDPSQYPSSGRLRSPIADTGTPGARGAAEDRGDGSVAVIGDKVGGRDIAQDPTEVIAAVIGDMHASRHHWALRLSHLCMIVGNRLRVLVDMGTRAEKVSSTLAILRAGAFFTEYFVISRSRRPSARCLPDRPERRTPHALRQRALHNPLRPFRS